MGTSYSYNIYIDNKSLFGSEQDTHGNRIVGYNKQLRDGSRICLFVNAVCLLLGFTFFASIVSIVAVFLISRGTVASTRNLRWGVTAYFSMVISFFTQFMGWAARTVDGDKAYTVKILFYILGRGTAFMWGATLCVFLFVAISNSQSNNIVVTTTAVVAPTSRVVECHSVDEVDRATWRSSEPQMTMLTQNKGHGGIQLAKKTS